MKAAVFERHGGPDVIRCVEVPEPKIQDTEVLVRVKACALNHLDLWVRAGLPGIQIPLPHIPGSDIAGVVAEVGNKVTNVKRDERVLLAPGISCGLCEQCAAGNDNLCRRYTLFGYFVDGGCAEYVKAPAANVIPIPGDLSFEEAAAIPLVFLTAWHMLIARARLEPGEDVLVLGAGSGVGSAAIQVARLVGARVFATVGSESKRKRAEEIGAEIVINHAERDFADEIRRLTRRRGVDVVVEHVGEATWQKSFACLAVNGRLVTCGATTGYDAKIDLRFLFSRHQSILGSYMGSKAELYQVLKLVGERKLRPVIDSTLPLTAISRAHARLESREQFGKIVMIP
jgi:NADPH:quinone reductase-like Zn-dependent oxidoreductase